MLMAPSTASRLVNDQEVMGLFAYLRSELLEEFARTPLTNTDQMLRLRMQVQCLEALKSRLESLAYDHRSTTK